MLASTSLLTVCLLIIFSLLVNLSVIQNLASIPQETKPRAPLGNWHHGVTYTGSHGVIHHHVIHELGPNSQF